jgi:hypothetical protein
MRGAGGGAGLTPAPNTQTTSGALGAWATAMRRHAAGAPGMATAGPGQVVPPSALRNTPSRQAAKTSCEAPGTPGTAG